MTQTTAATSTPEEDGGSTPVLPAKDDPFQRFLESVDGKGPLRDLDWDLEPRLAQAR